MATVVRPGAPAGPQTAISRPPAAVADDGESDLGLGLDRRPIGGGHRIRQCIEIVVGDELGNADPRRPDPTALDRLGGDHRHRADAMAAQMVDRRHIQPGGVEPEHRHVGLTGRGRRQEVVDVDAALEDDDAGMGAQDAEGRRLPGGPGGDHQDDDRGRGHQGRRTTEMAGSGIEPSKV